MGYGVAMLTRSYRYMSAEERETLSLGLARRHSLRTMATVLRRAPSTLSHESTRNTALGRQRLHVTDAGGSPGPAATATAQTRGPLAVAVRQDTPGPGLLARTDCRTPPTRLS